VAGVDNDIELLVIEERELSRAQRASSFDLFPEHWQQFGCNSPERGWTQLPPAWRVLVLDSRHGLLGQAGLVLVSVGDAVIGVSDVVVATQARREGVASKILETACRFADEQEHALMIDAGDEWLRRVLGRLGFESVTDQAVLFRAGERVVPPNWMYRGEVGGLELGSNF
jgi:GNAT superfamily N-acetyltransferase